MSRLPPDRPEEQPEARLGAQAEAERAFAARAARAEPGRARAILARAGKGRPPQPGDDP
jgi:hypothetical protein